MTEEKMGEVPEKTGENTEKLGRVALCLECTNEWKARNGNASKPSKCPECGTKRCVWKDTQTKTEEKPAVEVEKQGETPEKTEEKTGENRENLGEVPEKTERKAGENTEKKPIAVKTTISPVILPNNTGEKTGEKTEGENDDGIFHPVTGLPIVLVFGLLLVMGIVGGALWFLGRPQKLGSASNPTIPRQPTAAERAMMKISMGV